MAERIHFINVHSADAILLESNGNYALIDAGGNGATVSNYLKSINSSKTIKLNFAIATHAHGDHIGGFPTVLKDPNIQIDAVYYKKYPSDYWSNYHKYEADCDINTKTHYTNFVNSIGNRSNFTSESDLNKTIKLGKMEIKMYNTGLVKRAGMEENENSLVISITVNGRTALLTGDINDHIKTRTESRLVLPELQKSGLTVDLLKLSHHGYAGSNSKIFVEGLVNICLSKSKQLYAVATNDWKNVYANKYDYEDPRYYSFYKEAYNIASEPSTKDRFVQLRVPIYPTGDNGTAIIADFAKADYGLGRYKRGYYWYAENGKWTFKDIYSTAKMISNWLEYRPGEWYYLDSSGYMSKGWKEIGGKWYYLRASENDIKAEIKGRDGQMVTGWLKDDGYWFYLNNDGSMVTGSFKVGSKTYKFTSQSGNPPKGSLIGNR